MCTVPDCTVKGLPAAHMQAFTRTIGCPGATLNSGRRGDCLLHIPATSEMPARSSPCARLLYTQRPAGPAAAGPRARAAALADEGLQQEGGNAVSLEALASVAVSGGTISAADGDLALPWLGQLGNFFAIGMHRASFRCAFLSCTCVIIPAMHVLS